MAVRQFASKLDARIVETVETAVWVDAEVEVEVEVEIEQLGSSPVLVEAMTSLGGATLDEDPALS